MATVGTAPQGGLSHLVEAATALAQLNSPLQASKAARVVSEDDGVGKNATTGRCAKEPFPVKLMAMLNDNSLASIITWLPHGKAFVVLNSESLLTVLPKYLPGVGNSTKYASFTRKLNRWGFRQATRGADTGSFHHPLFCRDRPDLCLDMVCQRSRDRKDLKKAPASSMPSLTPLTQAALQSVSPDSEMQPATVSEDSRSVVSTSLSSNSSLPGGCISTDEELVAETLKRRDEAERMKVAKALLFEAYMKALDEK